MEGRSSPNALFRLIWDRGMASSHTVTEGKNLMKSNHLKTKTCIWLKSVQIPQSTPLQTVSCSEHLQHPRKICIVLCGKVKTEGEEDIKSSDQNKKLDKLYWELFC